MSAERVSTMTPEEYLAWEREAETKHEYLDGQVFDMAGASRQHSLIVVNLASELRARRRGSPCAVHSSDLRVQAEETGLYTYPDVVVACGQPRFADQKEDTLLNPKMIVEVLSPSTETNDRTWKWAHYRRLGSLAEYVMVSQVRYHVEQFLRQPDGAWLFREYTDAESVLRLPSLGCEIPLSEIYALVEMAP